MSSNQINTNNVIRLFNYFTNDITTSGKTEIASINLPDKNNECQIERDASLVLYPYNTSTSKYHSIFLFRRHRSNQIILKIISNPIASSPISSRHVPLPLRFLPSNLSKNPSSNKLHHSRPLFLSIHENPWPATSACCIGERKISIATTEDPSAQPVSAAYAPLLSVVRVAARVVRGRESGAARAGGWI